MRARCYSQRLLQPFRGLAQIVEIDGADAVSRDGLHWELYIQGGVDREQDERGAWIEIPLSDVKFGSWSAREGLSRYPTRQVADYDRINALGECLLEAVRDAAMHVPLPMEDRYELWLLDATGMPLALVDSVRDVRRLRPPERLVWRPGQLAEREFASAESCVRLAGLINAAARDAAWFCRELDGARELLVGPHGIEERGWRAADELPALLLRDVWPDQAAQALVRRFLEWQAPWLLTLPTLSPAVRIRVEAQAFRQALRVAEQHRNYPCVLDRHRLKAALVEAVLREVSGEFEPVLADVTEDFFVSGN